jgi:hypothetical protein
MSDIYTLVLNSQNSTNRTGSNINSYTYYINWDVVLDRIHQNYSVGFTLKSVNTSTSITVNGFVSINFGRSNCYEQSNSQTSKIGFFYPVCVQQTQTTFNYFFNATSNDNSPIEIAYPSNKFINVVFSDFNPSTTSFTMYDYVLELTFTPIPKN